jgi:hypothetical protein
MKNYILKLLTVTFLLTASFPIVRAQYSISAFTPPIAFTHLDLWHFAIMGSLDTNNAEYYVSVRIFNDQNTLLVKSNSSYFPLYTLPLYVAPTSLGALQPLTTAYTVDGFYANIVNTGGTFPAGNYVIDYTLYGRPTDGQFSELATYSLEAAVESLFPPMLISVENNDTICEPNPVFTWTPAIQPSANAVLTYNFKMAEVAPFQSTYQAIISNPYHYSQQEIPITMLTYPVYAATLILDHEYAWQVDAIINNQVAASSEIWSFVYGCPADTIIDSIPNLPYVKLRSENDGGVAKLSNKFLYINYTERYSPLNSQLSYKIFNANTNELMSNHNTVLDVIEGENYYIISTCGDGLDLPDGTYLFEATDVKGRRWYMRFIKEEIECN